MSYSQDATVLKYYTSFTSSCLYTGCTDEPNIRNSEFQTVLCDCLEIYNTCYNFFTCTLSSLPVKIKQILHGRKISIRVRVCFLYVVICRFI